VADHRIAQRYPTAFLTGASAGLGRAFTEMLLEEGVRVWGTARDAGRLTDLASRFPALFTPVIFDLADPVAGDAAFERATRAAGGAFDLVINNAGYGVFGAFDATGFRVWEAQLQAMLIATMRLSHAALRGMRVRDRGCLVNVSSLAADFPLPFMSGYNVAKAGLSAFTESLVVETRGSGISVIDFRPGDFRTGFNQTMQPVQLTGATAGSRAMSRAWEALERNLQAAPSPAFAAAHLRRALLRGRSGTVRAGSVFQARVAPFFTRLMPQALARWVTTRYFGL
jgi:short-subunit dehydrogenase